MTRKASVNKLCKKIFKTNNQRYFYLDKAAKRSQCVRGFRH